MAVGSYIYVGKSRVRRIRRERRKKRREEVRRKTPPPSGGSPCSGRIRYATLTSFDDGDNLSLLGCDIEKDSISLGSSRPENLLPLLDFYLALQLCPITEKLPPSIRMPFELFKKKDKKKPEPENTPAPEQKVDLPTKEEINKAVEVDDKVRNDMATNDQQDLCSKNADSEEHLFKTVNLTETPETVTEQLTPPSETIMQKEAQQENGQLEQEPSQNLPNAEPVEPEPESELEPEVVKDHVKLVAMEEVHANGQTEKEPSKLEPAPLQLEKIDSDEEAEKRMGVLCCLIL